MIPPKPPSSKQAFEIIREIIAKGWIKMPEKFKGSGAPGNTLEYLANIEENNYDSPDLMDWELKFHGGNALMTLFHKEPKPRGIMKKMVKEFGWRDDKGRISFRHTLEGESDKGFKVINKDDRITIINKHNPDLAPFWTHNIILQTMSAKLRRLIVVHGRVNKPERKVNYDKAVAYWDLDLMGICEAIEKGIIYIDFDARTKLGESSALRNHGTKFRIHIDDVGFNYKNKKIID